MDGTEILRYTLMGVFGCNALLLAVVLIAKPIHHRRQISQARRRSAYITVLARHLAIPDHTVDMGRKVADDQAFLDALIDMRSVVTGPEADALSTIVDTYEIGDRQTRRLETRLGGHRRLRAAVALAELADRTAAPTMMQHLSDREQEIRVQCARGLARVRWTEAIPVILNRFDSETPWVRSRFADSLAEFGTSATWPLLAHIRTRHRRGGDGVPTAVRTLGVIGDHEAVEPLVRILEDVTDPEVEIAIVETLGAIGAPVALDQVEKAARSEDWRVRAKAASALALLGNERIVPTIALGLEDENWWVRRNSAAALTRFPTGVDLLYRAVAGPDPYAGDSAAEALGDAGEVIAARDRIEAGLGSRRDFDLIECVEGALVTTT